MAAKAKFKKGDIVQLKSGGPEMTVEKLSEYEEGNVECQWFSGSKLQSGWFNQATLVFADEEVSQKKK